jgi:hypothetical protein
MDARRDIFASCTVVMMPEHFKRVRRNMAKKKSSQHQKSARLYRRYGKERAKSTRNVSTRASRCGRIWAAPKRSFLLSSKARVLMAEARSLAKLPQARYRKGGGVVEIAFDQVINKGWREELSDQSAVTSCRVLRTGARRSVDGLLPPLHFIIDS